MNLFMVSALIISIIVQTTFSVEVSVEVDEITNDAEKLQLFNAPIRPCLSGYSRDNTGKCRRIFGKKVTIYYTDFSPVQSFSFSHIQIFSVVY